MYILAIDTSCDETAVAITCERRIIANVLYSQILTHTQWGGVVPSLAKRAHEERIDGVIERALKRASQQLKKKLSISDMDYIAVTYGPGLAIALEVGIRKAKELAEKYGKKIIPVNHMSGHIYSTLAQNNNGKPSRDIQFPYLTLLASGGHTDLVLFKDHGVFEILGEKRDDAAGEALDKAGRMLGLGYPSGAAIERLASEVQNIDMYKLPRVMAKSHDLNFSFSGLKTAFMYMLKGMSEEEKATHVRELASSFQEAVFWSLLNKTEKAIQQTGIANLLVGGGVAANLYLRKRMRSLVKKYKGSVYFPPFKFLTGDNAAMIGIAAYYQLQKEKAVLPQEMPDREPRLRLVNH